MKQPLTEQQKKAAYTVIAGVAVGSFVLGFIISHIISKKRIDRLEAKIFKLEGWQ